MKLFDKIILFIFCMLVSFFLGNLLTVPYAKSIDGSIYIKMRAYNGDGNIQRNKWYKLGKQVKILSCFNVIEI